MRSVKNMPWWQAKQFWIGLFGAFPALRGSTQNLLLEVIVQAKDGDERGLDTLKAEAEALILIIEKVREEYSQEGKN